MNAAFYEFFCGGGMARVGFGPEWKCLIANDNDRRESGRLRGQLGGRQPFVGDVAKLTPPTCPASPISPGRHFLPGPLARRRSRGLDAARSGSFWRFCKLMHTTRRRTRAAADRAGERHRLADVAWRQGLRRDLRRVGRGLATALALS